MKIFNDALKSYEFNIPFTEQYFYEEFWFYYTAAIIVNSQFPLLQFNMEHQLSSEEFSLVDEESIFMSMRNLSFIIPKDRTTCAGVKGIINHPNNNFLQQDQTRYLEYSMLLKEFYDNTTNQEHDIEEDPQYMLIEHLTNRLLTSLQQIDNTVIDGLIIKQAFHLVILSKLIVFNTDLKEFVLNNRI